MQEESIALLDEDQTNILIHCAVHFGKNLNIMLDYYNKNGPGVQEEFSKKNIQELAKIQEKEPSFIEKTLHEEDIKLAKEHIKQYHQLQKVYESAPDELASRICDLILTENHDPTEEIAAIISCDQKECKNRLLAILTLQSFQSPLSPGYGLSPYHAANALGQMQCLEAIKPIFSLLAIADFNEQEILIAALKNIGDPALDFLVSRLKFTPFTEENELAAICLSAFNQNNVIISTAKNLLEQNPPETLQAYLTLLTE